MAMYGDMAFWVAVLINAALIAYQSLFPAIFALVVRRIVVAHGPRALMAAPLVWVATELGRTYIFTGFPWVLLGYSQTSVLPIAQFASLFGVYGVSMLVASVSAALATAFIRAESGQSQTAFSCGFAACVPAPVVIVLAVMAVAVWGSRRAATAEWTHSGRRDSCRPHSRQHRSGRKDPDGPRRRDLPGLPGHDPPGHPRRRRVRHLAGVVHAVPLRGRSAGRRADPHAGAAGQGADPVRQRSVRARRQRRADHVLQLGVSGAAGRHDRRRLPQDAPGAVRRIRAGQEAVVLRGPARAGGVGLLGG